MKTKLHFLTLLSLLLSGCSAIQVQDTVVCATAGIMAAGGSCAHTLTEETYDLDLNGWLDFLEPKAEFTDPITGKVTPARGAALCQNADDWNKIKTSLEQACKILGKRCTYEQRKALKDVGDRLNKLQAKVIAKAKPAPEIDYE